MYCPIAPRTPKIYARTIMSVFRMVWGHQCDVVFGREDRNSAPTKEQKYANITAKYNHARKLVLNGPYDALFTFENDVILPPLTLERLTRLDTDVAYGLYVSRHGSHKWLVATQLTMDYAEFLSDDRQKMKKLWGTAIETVGVGMGCTLIHRRVLEQICFRRLEGDKANDWYLALDCQEKGFRQMHDLGVVCGHIQGLPKPCIYWPDPEVLGGYRLEFFPDTEMIIAKDGKLVVPVGGDGVQLVRVQESKQ